MPGTNKTIATLSTAFTLYVGITISASIKATEVQSWRDALADCLLKQQIALGLKDGLAGYWLARRAVIGSDWKLQIEQIAGGRYYRWGNNPYWLSHSILDISHPPNFNFVVLSKDNSAHDVAAQFGRPNHEADCAGQQIWIYDNPLKLDIK